MKIKILLLINGLANSGSEQSLIGFLNYLDYEKYEAHILILKGPDDLVSLVPQEVKIHYLYKDNPYFDVSYICGLKKIFKDKNFKILLPFLSVKFLGLFNTKLCNHTCNSIRKRSVSFKEKFHVAIAYEYVTMKYLVNKINADKKIVRHNYGDIVVTQKDIELFKKCDNVIALTPLLKEELSEKFFIPKDKISVISSNFNNEEIINKSQEFNVDFKAQYNFVSVGRITELKRFDLIIDAMKILKDKNIDFMCHLIGGTCSNKDNENYFEKIKEQVINLGLENNINFVGETLNPFPYVKNCNIYLQASDVEAASRSVIEALILGKPCLSTETVGGKALIKEGIKGELCPVNDVKAFADKLIYMIENLDKYSKEPQFINNNKIMEEYYKIFEM